MLDNYDVQIFTKTLNTIDHIEEDYIELYDKHVNEGIIEIRLFDTKDGNYELINQIEFNPPLVDTAESTANRVAYRWIKGAIEAHEDQIEE